ncbi:MAG: coenzyme-B sulfoethylthiotransferase subunit gamma [Candidatus Methanomethyliales bacterium]|nr:coenzyme-B sulfoethylthiotransferase subunit gamma [Candidatus Methanomethylicales archaeon]
MVDYKPQYYPGGSNIAANRRKYIDPNYQLRKLRTISDDDLVRLMGHRVPGEAYKSVHPPLEELGEPACPIRELVEPTPGAKAGDRIRYIQFTDSVYFAPLTPYMRAWMGHMRYRGVDIGVLSGRVPLEARERDLEKVAKELVETEIFDPARVGIRGATVHGHALRLDENGLMFDALRRFQFDKNKGEVVYVKDQVGVPLDRPIYVGKPIPEDELRRITSQFRVDGEPFRNDVELIQFVQRIHMLRTEAGFDPNKVKDI